VEENFERSTRVMQTFNETFKWTYKVPGFGAQNQRNILGGRSP
jgi:hypothetical protein